MKNKEQLINLGFITIMFVYIITLYTNEWFAINTPDMEAHQKPLFDRGHELLSPKISAKYPDYMLFGAMVYFLIRWYKTNKLLLANYFFLVSVLFIMRIFVFMGTETPTPLKKCGNKNKQRVQYWHLKHLKWWFGIEDNTCIDNMFSGHTVHAVAMFLFTLFFSAYYFEKITMGLIALMIMISLIWSRMHYTSDVVVGFFLTIGYFFTAFEIERTFF